MARYVEVCAAENTESVVASRHAGKDLSHSAEVLFHLLLSDWFSFLGEFFGAHAMCNKLEKRDGIVDVREVGLKPNAGTVFFPLDSVGTV